MNINPNSKIVLTECYLEPELMKAVSEDKFQFVRNGYFCVDNKDSEQGKPIFNRIVSLKSSFNYRNSEVILMEGIGQKKETDYIFDKTIKCDVCGKEFKTKQVRTGKARFIGTDDILKPLYEGIDTCKYDIIMCPHCGYAASLRLFGHHTEKQRQAVRDNVSSRFTAKEPETETYSYERAVKRCKMAMLTEMVTGGKISESAYLCLKLAWIYRGEIQEAKANGAAQERISMYERYEKEYLEDAYRGFKQARETEYPPIAGMDENTITYLLTSIGIHCGKIDEARRYGSALLISRTASMKLKNKTRDVLETIKKN